MLIRRERGGDETAVREVTRAAFGAAVGTPDPPVEVPLLESLRADPGWLPPLSLVAESDGAVVGHVVGTRGTVEGVPAVGLGPLSVHPGVQRHGIGSLLVHAVVAAAEARDEVLVALLGDPAFYGRLGFEAAADHGVVAPDPAWGRFFQVRALGGPAPRGRFAYADPFGSLRA